MMKINDFALNFLKHLHKSGADGLKGVKRYKKFSTCFNFLSLFIIHSVTYKRWKSNQFSLDNPAFGGYTVCAEVINGLKLVSIFKSTYKQHANFVSKTFLY